MTTYVPAKDPNAVEPYFFVWCSKTNQNDGATTDTGELQSATISTHTATAATGLTVDSSSLASVTVAGINYSVNTVVTVWLSGGTNNTDYEVLCRITTNETPSRTLDKTMTVPVRSQ